MREWQACKTASGDLIHLYDLTRFPPDTPVKRYKNRLNMFPSNAMTRCGDKATALYFARLKRGDLCAACTRGERFEYYDIGVSRIYECEEV